MKDECCGKIVTEIVCLRSKLYAICIEYKDYVKKAKGVKACVMKNIEFQDYLDCLIKQNLKISEQISIRSYGHIVVTEKVNKLVLSYNDDKRFIIKESTDTLPWGHYKIDKVDVSNINQDAEMV